MNDIVQYLDFLEEIQGLLDSMDIETVSVRLRDRIYELKCQVEDFEKAEAK